jgi:hypothetical protein
MSFSLGRIDAPFPEFASALHFAGGEYEAIVEETRLDFSIVAQAYVQAHLEASASTSTYIFMVDDAPLQRKLGIY